jgi:hypothetical protein
MPTLKALGIDPTAIQAWMGHKSIQPLSIHLIVLNPA